MGRERIKKVSKTNWFLKLTTEGFPCKSLSIVGAGELLAFPTVTSQMAGTNECIWLTAETNPWKKKQNSNE